MALLHISSLDAPGVELFSHLTEAQLRNSLECDRGIFIAESPKVIRLALSAGLEPLALLCEERHLEGDAADIVARCKDLPIFTGERSLLARLTGYTLTRGVLCAMRRPLPLHAAALCPKARRVAVIDAVSDTTNIGAIFRSAAALGIDAVFLTPSSCDPLNRRAVRVSMGSVFLVPWAWIESPKVLQSYGFKTVAMALRADALPIDSELLAHSPKLALIFGTEGEGLSPTSIQEADLVARIPMHRGVDSLNVAAAAAIAFWQLRIKD